MNWIYAVLLTIGAFICEVVIGFLMQMTIGHSLDSHISGYVIAAVGSLIIGTGAAFDARKIGFDKYEGFVSTPPIGVVLMCVLFNLFFLLLYFQKRWKITHGQAKLKPQYATAAETDQ